MAVYTGLIEQLHVSDDELAAVMGHEIAHALREHGREKVGQAAGVGMAAAIGGALIGSYYGVDPNLGQSVLGAAGDLAFMRPNSRGMEQETDRIGVELARVPATIRMPQSRCGRKWPAFPAVVRRSGCRPIRRMTRVLPTCTFMLTGYRRCSFCAPGQLNGSIASSG